MRFLQMFVSSEISQWVMPPPLLITRVPGHLIAPQDPLVSYPLVTPKYRTTHVKHPGVEQPIAPYVCPHQGRAGLRLDRKSQLWEDCAPPLAWRTEKHHECGHSLSSFPYQLIFSSAIFLNEPEHQIMRECLPHISIRVPVCDGCVQVSLYCTSYTIVHNLGHTGSIMFWGISLSLYLKLFWRLAFRIGESIDNIEICRLLDPPWYFLSHFWLMICQVRHLARSLVTEVFLDPSNPDKSKFY